MNHLFIGFACLIFASVVFAYNPRECSKASDCGPNECCVVGMERFSLPWCKPMGKSGDQCLMENEPEDKELYYPDKMMNVTGVYRLFCPCEDGLACSEAKCTSNTVGEE